MPQRLSCNSLERVAAPQKASQDSTVSSNLVASCTAVPNSNSSPGPVALPLFSLPSCHALRNRGLTVSVDLEAPCPAWRPHPCGVRHPRKKLRPQHRAARHHQAAMAALYASLGNMPTNTVQIPSASARRGRRVPGI